MKGELGEGNTFEKEAAFVNHFNRLVHADPAGSLRNTGHAPDGLFGFLAGANIGSPKLCDYICIWAAFCLGVLHRRASQLFPDAGFDGDAETVREFASFLMALKPE